MVRQMLAVVGRRIEGRNLVEGTVVGSVTCSPAVPWMFPSVVVPLVIPWMVPLVIPMMVPLVIPWVVVPLSTLLQRLHTFPSSPLSSMLSVSRPCWSTQ